MTNKTPEEIAREANLFIQNIRNAAQLYPEGTSVLVSATPVKGYSFTMSHLLSLCDVAEKDYKDMRHFQAEFMRVDHELRELKAAQTTMPSREVFINQLLKEWHKAEFQISMDVLASRLYDWLRDNSKAKEPILPSVPYLEDFLEWHQRQIKGKKKQPCLETIHKYFWDNTKPKERPDSIQINNYSANQNKHVIGINERPEVSDNELFDLALKNGCQDYNTGLFIKGYRAALERMK